MLRRNYGNDNVDNCRINNKFRVGILKEKTKKKLLTI